MIGWVVVWLFLFACLRRLDENVAGASEEGGYLSKKNKTREPLLTKASHLFDHAMLSYYFSMHVLAMLNAWKILSGVCH